MRFTALIEREGDGYTALCPEVDVASQGNTIEEARDNLTEALELFLKYASPEEVKQRLHGKVFVTQVELVGKKSKPGTRNSLKGIWKDVEIDDALFDEAKKSLFKDDSWLGCLEDCTEIHGDIVSTVMDESQWDREEWDRQKKATTSS
jgi:predicted RNase H-like HicB family nuclease